MDNCRILCQVMADMENFYDDLIIINLYPIVNAKESQKSQILYNFFVKNGQVPWHQTFTYLRTYLLTEIVNAPIRGY